MVAISFGICDNITIGNPPDTTDGAQMETYFLQHGVTITDRAAKGAGHKTTLADPRTFLDTFQHPLAELIATISAPNWLAAREIAAEKYFV